MFSCFPPVPSSLSSLFVCRVAWPALFRARSEEVEKKSSAEGERTSTNTTSSSSTPQPLRSRRTQARFEHSPCSRLLPAQRPLTRPHAQAPPPHRALSSRCTADLVSVSAASHRSRLASATVLRLAPANPCRRLSPLSLRPVDFLSSTRPPLPLPLSLRRTRLPRMSCPSKPPHSVAVTHPAYLSAHASQTRTRQMSAS